MFVLNHCALSRLRSNRMLLWFMTENQVLGGSLPFGVFAERDDQGRHPPLRALVALPSWLTSSMAGWTRFMLASWLGWLGTS